MDKEIMLEMRVIHQNEHFVVVDKDSGLLSVPGRGPDKQDCVANRIKTLDPFCIDQPSVHRLDMDTSGLMVLAFDKTTHRNLSIQFQDRVVEKKYIALLDGIVEGEAGIIELPFRLDVDNRPHQIYDEEFGKWGTTHWKKLEEINGKTLIEFKPITGRTHQLRVHSAHEKGLGIPIVGDPLYGTGTGPGQLKLHAAELSFFHPITNEKLTFKSAPRFSY